MAPVVKPAVAPVVKPAVAPVVKIDALLRRVERTAVVVCAVMTVGALAIGGGRLRPALAVMAGGILALVSYRMIVSSAEGLVGMMAPAAPVEGDPASPARPSPVLTAARVAGRYALLAVLAYVMIARLRLPPLGLLAGGSSVVAAISLEAVRLLSTKTR